MRSGRPGRTTIGLVLVVCLAVIAGAYFGSNSSSASSSQFVRHLRPPRFESAPCPAKSPPVPALANARCGYLVVPENRTKANGKTIRLAVAIISATSPTPAPDPIVFLAGGPGTDALGFIPVLTDAGVNRDRELIVLAQRGTIDDGPALMCPEIPQFYTTRLGLVYGAPSTGKLYVQATTSCRRRLANAGIDLGAYNNTESATDVADLRTALRIPQWNVFGHSNGTEVSLVYMRDHPAGIRSVALEGVVPPSVTTPGYNWVGVKESLDNMVAACIAQPACQTRYPNLRATFTGLVNRLEAHPITTTVTPPGASAALKVVVDGGVLVNWEVLETHFPAEFPLAVDQLAHGNPQLVATRWATGRANPAEDTLAYGMNFSVTCSDEEPFESAAQALRAGQHAFPAFPRSVQGQAPNNVAFTRQACNAWNVPKSPDSGRAVTRSTIPTLLENGSFDGQTAASGARYAARTLPNSIVTIFSGQAHGAFATLPCAASVIVSFFDNPKAPNTSCVASVQPVPFDTTSSPPPPAESGSAAPSD